MLHGTGPWVFALCAKFAFSLELALMGFSLLLFSITNVLTLLHIDLPSFPLCQETVESCLRPPALNKFNGKTMEMP